MKVFAAGAFFGAVVLCAGVAAGEVKALDFETEAERRLMPSHRLDRLQSGVTNVFASSGRNSFFFRMRPWRKGEDQWPLFVLRTPVRDWSGYDRLVIDIVNLDCGGDTISLSVSGPGVGDFAGLGASMTLKPFSVSRWEIPLEKWPEKMSASNVEKIGFCVTRPGGCEVYVDNFMLLKRGEQAPEAKYGAASLAKVEARRKAYADERRAKREAMCLESLCLFVHALLYS